MLQAKYLEQFILGFRPVTTTHFFPFSPGGTAMFAAPYPRNSIDSEKV